MFTLAAVVLWGSAGVALLWTTYRSLSRWGERGARPFTALVGGVALSAVAHAATGLHEGALFLATPVLLYVTPLLWANFAFDYTGRYVVATRGRRALLALPSAYLVCAHFGFSFGASRLLGIAPWEYEFVMVDRVVAATPGWLRTPLHLLNAGQFIADFFVLGIALVATVVLVSQALEYDHPSPAVVVGLSVAALAPMLVQMGGVTAAMSADVPMAATRLPVAAAHLVSGVGFAAVFERSRLFAAAPAAGTVGTKRVLADLPEPVVVADHDERVVRVNPSARSVFDAEDDVVGRTVADLLDTDVASLRRTDSLDLEGSDGKRHYEPDVSEMFDGSGTLLGYTLVLRDVTSREMRQQRLEVLNRVLRHNLRNDMTTIRGRAELLAAGDGDAMALGDAITDTADDLVQLGERAREIEQMLSVGVRRNRVTPGSGDERSESAGVQPNPQCDLGSVVRHVVEEVTDGREADVTVDVPETVLVGADERVLAPVVRNLIVNAVQHTDRDDPSIEVTATVGRGQLPITLTVTDDGPGLPENERRAVERGHEDPLEHGSGLGLWAVKWGVTRMGGQLSIEESQPRGTTVRIALPIPSGPADSESGPETGDTLAD